MAYWKLLSHRKGLIQGLGIGMSESSPTPGSLTGKSKLKVVVAVDVGGVEEKEKAPQVWATPTKGE
jgi:hypothetical protein